MVTVTGLFIYPIKSLGGIALRHTVALERGLQHDRRLMLVDQSGMFLTQREFPEMAHLQTELIDDKIRVTDRRTNAHMDIDLLQLGDEREVHVWDDTLTARRLSSHYDAFLSDALAMNVSLVTMNNGSHRVTSDGSQVSLADGYPHLIVSEASLSELNRRLDNPVGMNRFRPNIVVDGVDAHEEDHFQTIGIGDATIKVTKPCGRCVLTTVDPETAQKGLEPLATLSTYRKEGNNVNFGANAITLKEGKFAVGDKVELLPY